MRKMAFLSMAAIVLAIYSNVALPKVVTWDYLMSDEALYHGHDPNLLKLNPLRYMYTVDLNGDDVNDLILSESVSSSGTGGTSYDIYLGIGDQKYVQIYSLGANGFALEPCPGGMKRLWWYTHSSSQSGSLWNIRFEGEYRYRVGEPLEIYPGDGGTAIGNAMLDAIFTEESCLKRKEVKRKP